MTVDARVMIEAGAISARYGFESWASVTLSDQFYFVEQAWMTRVLNNKDNTPNYGDFKHCEWFFKQDPSDDF